MQHMPTRDYRLHILFWTKKYTPDSGAPSITYDAIG